MENVLNSDRGEAGYVTKHFWRLSKTLLKPGRIMWLGKY